MKENYRPESCSSSIPAGSLFDLLNRCVDRFRAGNARLLLDRNQDSTQMCFDHFPNLDHRLQTTMQDPAQERLPVPPRNSSVGVGPEPIGHLSIFPSSRRFYVQSRQAQKGSIIIVLILCLGRSQWCLVLVSGLIPSAPSLRYSVTQIMSSAISKEAST